MKREEGLVQPHPSKKVTTLVQKIQDSEVVPKYLGGSGTLKDADNRCTYKKSILMSIHLNLFRILSRHFTFQANLKDAMERLEELVLHATESALRESTETGPSWDVLVNDGVFMCIFAVFQKNVARKWKNHRRILASKFRAMSPVSMKIQC